MIRRIADIFGGVYLIFRIILGVDRLEDYND